MQLLHLDSSLLGDASASRPLTKAIVDTFRQTHAATDVIYRDLAVESIPHLDGNIAAGFRPVHQERLDDGIVAEHARSEALVVEFLASDVIVIGAPMYNFSIPTQLKAWIDRVVQPGRTFHYTEHGPVGLSGGKRIIVASTRGGAYSEGAAKALDFQEAYLSAMFGFLGITDVQFVRAERLSRGPEIKTQAMDEAMASARTLAAVPLTA